MSPIGAARSFGNMLGLTWWARVETNDPKVTYWFGPFLTRRSLRSNLSIFVEDLSQEGAHSVEHRIYRCRRGEPLTI